MASTQIKIRYLTALILPSKLVNRMQVIKNAEAFYAVGTDTVLCVRELHDTKDNILGAYGVSRLPIEEVRGAPFWPRSFWQARAYSRYVAQLPAGIIFYTRDILLAYFLILLSPKFRNTFFFECHSLGKFPHIFYRKVFGSACGIISTNHAKKDFIVKNYDIVAEKILVAPNGYDEAFFDVAPDRKTAREQLGLDQHEKIVMYVGSTQPWKGVDIIAKLAERLPDIRFMIIGGDKKEPYTRVPLFLKAADVLLAPYQGDDARVQQYFSPVKVFEYMASGTPMVVSDLLALREIVDEECALFALSEDIGSFVQQIERIFAHPEEATARAKVAQKRAHEFSWRVRAGRIVEFMQKLS